MDAVGRRSHPCRPDNRRDDKLSHLSERSEMNIGALVLVALGLVVVIIALRGTQSQVFPGLFNQSSSSTSSSPQPAPVGSGSQLKNPNPDGSCPAGTRPVLVSGGKVMCL